MPETGKVRARAAWGADRRLGSRDIARLFGAAPSSGETGGPGPVSRVFRLYENETARGPYQPSISSRIVPHICSDEGHGVRGFSCSIFAVKRRRFHRRHVVRLVVARKMTAERKFVDGAGMRDGSLAPEARRLFGVKRNEHRSPLESHCLIVDSRRDRVGRLRVRPRRRRPGHSDALHRGCRRRER